METHIDKISLEDPRIQWRDANLNGKTYGYLYAEPTDYSRTIFLIHGFPDISMGWRYQVNLLLRLGLRVIVPDCLGYGRSDSPTGDITQFSLKSQCEDFYSLAVSLDCKSIILAGHDWGSVLASRFALYFPGFVSHLIQMVVPYFPPSREYISVSDLVKIQPSFGYMLQFGSEDGVIESHTKDRDGIRNFLNCLYGGLTQDGRKAISATNGVNFDLARQLSPSKLLDEDDMKLYVDEYARNGLRGPCNTYRVLHQNFLDELLLVQEPQKQVIIECPTLFIRAADDFAITSKMVESMNKYIPRLTIEEIKASHWVMVQCPYKVNRILEDWLQKQVLAI